MKENDIQRDITNALKSDGFEVIRTNAGKTKVRGGYMQLAPAGFPDLIVLDPERGEVAFIEVKNESGRLRTEQKEYEAEYLTNFTHGVARSVEEAKAIVKDKLRGYGYK